LQGGDLRRGRRRRPPRRRRRGGRLALGLVVLAVLVSLGVWLFSGIGGGGKKGHDVLTPPAITTGSPSKKRARNEGPPGIRLFGGPTVNVNFKAPPKAGLLVDMKTG